MRVVVVGATGNVGTSLVRSLGVDSSVDEIVGLARRVPSLQMPKTSWAPADVVHSDLVELFRGADAVVHLAWLIQPQRDKATLHTANVDGSARVFDAVGAAAVPALVYASSVGAYSPGPKDRQVDESWATDGIPSSAYSREKAEVERLLDRFEQAHGDTRVVRLRPGLIFKREAASEIRRYFVGPFLPRSLVRRELIPVVPATERLRFQAVHSDDVGEAYRLAVTNPEARGPYNIAADPVLDPRRLGELLDARPVPVPAPVLRGAASLTWRLRLQPTEPSWVDLALETPLLDSGRARRELGWEPRRRSDEALDELIEGIRDGAGFDTPPLEPRAGGPLRIRELLTGLGAKPA
jgi:UDP-glucose 4-epimerase